jgi:hypothetical protein
LSTLFFFTQRQISTNVSMCFIAVLAILQGGHYNVQRK